MKQTFPKAQPELPHDNATSSNAAGCCANCLVKHMMTHTAMIPDIRNLLLQLIGKANEPAVLFSTQQAAEILLVDRRTVSRWRKGGKLVPELIEKGDKAFYTLSQLRLCYRMRWGRELPDTL